MAMPIFDEWCTALRYHAKHTPDRLALLDGERSMTYAELSQQVDALALGLIEKGLSRGDRVVIMVPDSLELVVATFAVGRAGGVYLLGNIRMPANMVSFLLKQLEPRLFITVSQTTAVSDVPALVGTMGLPHSMDIILAGAPGEKSEMTDLLTRSVTPAEQAMLDQRQIKPEEDFAFFYTSGTTGTPKAAVHPARNMMHWGYVLRDWWKLGDDEVLLNSPPLGSTFSQVFGFGLAMPHGYTYGILGLPPDPARFLRYIDQYRATLTFGISTFYLQCMADSSFKTADLSSHRYIATGGAPVSPERIKIVEGAFKVPVYNIYGSSETCIMATPSVEHSDEIRRQGALVILDTAEIEIRDANGQVLGPNQQGQVFITSPTVMSGYYKMPDLTATRLIDGWWASGDMGTISEQGHLTLRGRVDDMILRGGNNVYLTDLEAVVKDHPQVINAAAVGIPDPLLGQVPHLFVILRADSTETPETLKEYCKENMMPYYVPKEIHVRDSLPTTPSGKVRKFILQGELIEQLGQPVA